MKVVKGLSREEPTSVEKIFEIVQGLEPIANKLDCSVGQLALAWCVKNPNITTVITGASKVKEIVEDFKTFEVMPKLDEQVMEDIEKVLDHKKEKSSREDYGSAPEFEEKT